MHTELGSLELEEWGDKGGIQPTVRYTLTIYDRERPLPLNPTMALLPEILGVLLLILKFAG